MKSTLALTIALLGAVSAQGVSIETVPVGNPGNASDTTGFGSVAGDFQIGTFEVTNRQYAGFLNVVAATDTFALYNMGMGGDRGGITRSGPSGNYTYALKPGMENKPVNFMNWYNAIRFSNWLHNGQGGPGTTEYGAYTLEGGTPLPNNPSSITRNPGARWWLPNWDEWYKAAYYNPATETYFSWPMRSNSVPTAEHPPGGANSGNFDSVSVQFTDVGAYFLSDSPYGTFDQGGNAWEWTETPLGAVYRSMRGGSTTSSHNELFKTQSFQSADPMFASDGWGFRVATIVPEPATYLLLLTGCGLFLHRRRKSVPEDRIERAGRAGRSLICPVHALRGGLHFCACGRMGDEGMVRAVRGPT